MPRRSAVSVAVAAASVAAASEMTQTEIRRCSFDHCPIPLRVNALARPGVDLEVANCTNNVPQGTVRYGWRDAAAFCQSNAFVSPPARPRACPRPTQMVVLASLAIRTPAPALRRWLSRISS